DTALTPFPEADAQRAAVQKLLDDAVDARLCVQASGQGAKIDVALANRKVGHGFPSGSNQDRRAWIELSAFVGSTAVLETGKIPAHASVAAAADPVLFLLRDHIFAANGAETELFWQAVRFTSAQLPAALTSNPTDPAYDNSVHASYN